MGMFLLCLLRCSDDAGIQNLAIDFAGFPVDRFFPTKKSHKYLWEKKAKTPFFPTSTCGIFQTSCWKFAQGTRETCDSHCLNRGSMIRGLTHGNDSSP